MRLDIQHIPVKSAMKLTKWPYIIKPLVVSLVGGTGVFLFSFFQDTKNLQHITKSLTEIVSNASFGLLLFSTTSLLQLSFIYSRTWFKRIITSCYFKSFIDRLLLSTIFAMMLLFVSFFCIFLTPYYSRIICSIINTSLVSLFLFTSMWIWNCVDDLLSMYD